MTVYVPTAWDLTGFSGGHETGYVRIDDGEEIALEIKWATEAKKSKAKPDVTVRRDSYFRSLRETAKKKKIDLDTRETDAPRGVPRDDRTACGFAWTGDRKAVGAIWYCATCRRVVIAQVLGPRSGKGGLMGIAEGVLQSLKCHGDDLDWQTWALYDLHTEVPTEYVLQSQQLMNVYLRLQFAHKTARLTIEQWALANVARRDAYLDKWLRENSKGEIAQARYQADEAETHGHPALRLEGGLAFGMPMTQAVREVARLQRPATRFEGLAWECEPSNKVYTVQALRPSSLPSVLDAVVERTHCHEGDAPC